MNKLVVLDVMPLLYRGHFALLSRPRRTSSGFNTSAIFVYTNIVRDFISSRGATHAALVMDTSPTFRSELYPEYKAQRDKLPEDIAASIGPAEEFAKALRIPFLRVPGFEADDLMGTLSRMADEDGSFETWLVSPDKDIAQLVSEKTVFYRPSAGSSSVKDEIYDIAKVCAEWHIGTPAEMVDYLGMAGDASDNIPGFPGVGPKTASSLIEKYGSLENVIANASSIKGKLGENILAHADQARLSRVLATIRRDVPVSVSLEDLRIADPDLQQMEAFCRKYELSTLLKHYIPEADIGGGGSGGDLFAFAAASAKPRASAAPAEASAVDASVESVQFDTVDTVPHDYRIVDSEAALATLCAELSTVERFAFDTETMGLNPRQDKCVGISICTVPHKAWYIPLSTKSEDSAAQFGDLFAFAGVSDDRMPAGTSASGMLPDGMSILPIAMVRAALSPFFSNPAITKIGHNAKFDIHVLHGIGIEVKGRIADSMLAHYVVDSAARHGMNPLAREYLRYDPIPIDRLIGSAGKGQTTMDMVDIAKVAEYAAEDADITLQLHLALEPKVREQDAWRAYDEAELPLVHVLADMEREGVRIDTEALRVYGVELGAEVQQIADKIYSLAGECFNIDSSQQLSQILFDKLQLRHASKTTTGHYSTAEDVLQGLATEHPIVPLVLDYRACSKLKSTYVDKLPKFIESADGRIHTTFNQALTETGRLSSDRPNLQNIPVRTDRGKRIRAAVIARDSDHLLLSADYSQIELRMMAAMSGDEAMIEAFRTGADIHRETASRVYGVAPEAVTKEQRSFCKQVNFGIIYGISPFGLSQRLGCSRSVAEGLIRTYFATFPKVRTYLDEVVATARANGYVTTILGRRRPLPDIVSRNATIRAGAERNAMNTPVQGSAADLIKLAMVRVHSAIRERGLGARLVLQVHDELLFDVPKSEVEEVSVLVRDAMQNAIKLAVPLVTDIGCGANWLAAH